MRVSSEEIMILQTGLAHKTSWATPRFWLGVERDATRFSKSWPYFIANYAIFHTRFDVTVSEAVNRGVSLSYME